MTKISADSFIRNFNLYVLSGIELEEPYLSIYNSLEYSFKDLIIYKSSIYKDILYIGISKRDLYIRYDSKSNEIDVRDFIYHYLCDENLERITTYDLEKVIIHYINYLFNINGIKYGTLNMLPIRDSFYKSLSIYK